MDKSALEGIPDEERKRQEVILFIRLGTSKCLTSVFIRQSSSSSRRRGSMFEIYNSSLR